MMDDRKCEYCGNPLPSDARRDQRFCSRSHKSAARKKRRKREEIRAGLVTAGIPVETLDNFAESHAADARFRAMIAAEQATTATRAQEAEWAAYARRHGSIHPNEQAARIARGQQARASDWQQGTARFQRPVSSIAEQARASRSAQRRPVIHQGDWDVDELEAPTMTEGNIFRTGYRHATGYR